MSAGDTLLRAAAVQMNSVNNKEANLKKAGQLIHFAAENGAKIVVLPEMFNFSGRPRERKENAESVPGPTINYLRELGVRFNIYLLCGSILEESESRDERIFCNTSVFLNPEGEIIGKYRKLHLFDVTLPDGSSWLESELITGGNQAVQVRTPLALFGLTVCYDLRFPELYRRLAIKGAQIVFIPSAFTLETGKDHWEILVRARAIENQLYIIAPNQVGEDVYGRRYWGKSIIVDPWGASLAKAPEKETVIFAQVDLSYQQKVRKNLPSLSHIREDIFNF